MPKSQITTTSIANAAVDTTQLAADAVDNTILDVAGDYAFTGTVSGAGTFVKLLTSTISSTVSNLEISDTYVNSTYDDYFILFNALPSVDNRNFQVLFHQGGSFDTGNNYGVETYNMVANTGVSSNGTSAITIAQSGVGAATGEHASGYFYLKDVNSTVVTTTINGQYNITTNTGNHTGGNISGGQIMSARTNPVRGLRFKFNSDDIASGVITLYGVQK